MPACRSLERLSRRKWRPTSSHKRRLRYSRKKSASKEPRPPLAAPKHERLLFGDEKNRGATTASPKRLQERLYCVNVMVWAAPAPASRSIESCAKMVVVEQPSEGAPSMGKSITDLSSVTTVGLDLRS